MNLNNPSNYLLDIGVCICLLWHRGEDLKVNESR
jgi:hypothetical protein